MKESRPEQGKDTIANPSNTGLDFLTFQYVISQFSFREVNSSLFLDYTKCPADNVGSFFLPARPLQWGPG